MTDAPIIRADRATRSYGSGRGVHEISFDVHAGECFAVLGANGSGKTTLTRLVTGVDRCADGRITVFGRESWCGGTALRRRWGVAQDVPAHWPELSGRNHLRFFLRCYGLHGAALEARLAELLELGDLTNQADDPMSQYSFGMRRKTQVLAALGPDPELLILDEPSAGADEAFLGRLCDRIRERSRCGKTTYLADNRVAWVAATADRALLLEAGRERATGGASDVARLAADVEEGVAQT